MLGELVFWFGVKAVQNGFLCLFLENGLVFFSSSCWLCPDAEFAKCFWDCEEEVACEKAVSNVFFELLSCLACGVGCDTRAKCVFFYLSVESCANACKDVSCSCNGHCCGAACIFPCLFCGDDEVVVAFEENGVGSEFAGELFLCCAVCCEEFVEFLCVRCEDGVVHGGEVGCLDCVRVDDELFFSPGEEGLDD